MVLRSISYESCAVLARFSILPLGYSTAAIQIQFIPQLLSIFRIYLVSLWIFIHQNFIHFSFPLDTGHTSRLWNMQRLFNTWYIIEYGLLFNAISARRMPFCSVFTLFINVHEFISPWCLNDDHAAEFFQFDRAWTGTADSFESHSPYYHEKWQISH